MDGLATGAKYQAITVTPASPSVGAEIGNIDLTNPLTDLELAEIKRAFLEFGVLFFATKKSVLRITPGWGSILAPSVSTWA